MNYLKNSKFRLIYICTFFSYFFFNKEKELEGTSQRGHMGSKFEEGHFLPIIWVNPTSEYVTLVPSRSSRSNTTSNTHIRSSGSTSLRSFVICYLIEAPTFIETPIWITCMEAKACSTRPLLRWFFLTSFIIMETDFFQHPTKFGLLLIFFNNKYTFRY